MGCEESASINPASPSLRPAAYKDENDYSEEALFLNQKPLPVSGKQLKTLLHRSIGALTFLDQKRNFRAGTAVLISHDIILTVAHNIFSKQDGFQNKNFKFYLGADGVGDKYHQIESWRFPSEFKSCQISSKLQHDYAIMKLKQPIKFDEYLSISQLCSECLLKNNQKVKIKIFGFPFYQQNFSHMDHQGKIKLTQYGLIQQDRIVQIDVSQFKIGYKISTLPGQSGCPVVIADKIIAIHVGMDKDKTFNIGRIVDNDLINKIWVWRQQLKAENQFPQKKKVCRHDMLILKTYKKNCAKKLEQLPIPLRKKEQQRQQSFSPARIKQYKIANQFVGRPKIIVRPIHFSQIEPGGLKYSKQTIYEADTDKNINLRETEPFKPLLAKINPILDLSQKSLSNVDLSQQTLLTNLNLSGNILQQIDISHCLHLRKLYLQRNNLRSIDLSKNKNITQLILRDNKLPQIEVSQNVDLSQLYLRNNVLVKINVRQNTNLIHLDLRNNRIYDIDLSFNTKLTKLDLSFNKLQQISLKTNTCLTHLYLSDNKLQKINLTNNSKLQQLYLHFNELKEVDLQNNLKVGWLWLCNNKLTRIQLPILKYLPVQVYIDDNRFNLSHQMSEMCLVQLIFAGQAVRNKALTVANHWKIRYAQKEQSKYNCTYNYVQAL